MGQIYKKNNPLFYNETSFVFAAELTAHALVGDSLSDITFMGGVCLDESCDLKFAVVSLLVLVHYYLHF